MAPQNFANHRRSYTPHHFIFYPLMIAAFIASIRFMCTIPDQAHLWAAVSFIVIMVTWLSFMMRQHYALVLQNRMVRLELRLRYYQLTQRRLEDLEHQLSFKQLAALRFASDSELPSLVERAVREGLSPDHIKRSITDWLPDNMRV